MSIKNYQSNAFYEEFDTVNQYGYISHHYLRVMRSGDTSFSNRELEARKSMLDLGFAPAVIIYKSFEEFLAHTRDF